MNASGDAVSLARNIAKKLHAAFGDANIMFEDLSCRDEMRLLSVAEDILFLIDQERERKRSETPYIIYFMKRCP